MTTTADITGYRYHHAELGCAHAYLLPTVTRILSEHFAIADSERRVFDVGCGNGAVAAYLAAHGYQVAGVDPSAEGVAQARSNHPELQIEQGSAYDDLAARFGTFPAVISLEVVEHVYAPRAYAATIYSLLQPGGLAVLSWVLEEPGDCPDEPV